MSDDTTNNQEPAQPPPCNPNVYRDGVPIFVTHSIRSFKIEPWVRKIAALSGQPVDWHFAGGRAIVLACGDVEKARVALMQCLREHDAMFREACGDTMSAEQVTRYLVSMREYSGLNGRAEIGETGEEEREKYIARVG